MLENAFEAMDDLFLIFDQEFKFKRWNKRVEKITKYNEGELSSMRPSDFFEEKDRQKITKSISEAIDEKETVLEANIVMKIGKNTI